ncbi:MAG: tRNA dihydrouridine synthase DusB [Nitrospinae bacterium]|nr:tRNA dihydrouridine synthase DusB [Nitrospinota bacterium]
MNSNAWRIGPVSIPFPTVMAPIAGGTDAPFRRIVMEQGAGLTVSELISANALVRDSKRTMEMLPDADEPRPVATQLFGGEPEVVAEAAAMVDALDRCDLIDLNYGCPVKKVTKCGAGAALLKDPLRAGELVRQVVAAVKRPVTAKIRIGWDFQSVQAVDMARRLADAGAAAIAIHGRTASQGYGGRADWQVIEQAARAVAVPVIGNGDITTPEEGVARLRDHGCAAVMIGRGALGNPWIFDRINRLLAGKEAPPPPPEQVRDGILRHLGLMAGRYGDGLGARLMRAHFAYYARGFRGAARLRKELNGVATIAAQGALIVRFFEETEREEAGPEAA